MITKFAPFFQSFTTVLPWSTCNNHWNTRFCYSSDQSNTSQANSSFINDTYITENKKTASEEFFSCFLIFSFLCCLTFCDLRLLIIYLVSSYISYFTCLNAETPSSWWHGFYFICTNHSLLSCHGAHAITIGIPDFAIPVTNRILRKKISGKLWRWYHQYNYDNKVRPVFCVVHYAHFF
jgi:hypothetical protein